MADHKFSEQKDKDQADKTQSTNEQEHVKEAHEQAEKDIAKDVDLKPDENEDLDEGELAKKEGHP